MTDKEIIHLKQEPVAVVDEIGKRLDGTNIFNAIGKVDVGQPLYAAPVQQVEQECKDCTRSHPHEEMSKCCELRTEIARLRHSLRVKELAEQAEQEPVAWMSPRKERLEFSTKSTVYGSHTIPLYAAPQPVQEPIGYVIEDDSGYTGSMIYANKGGDCFLPVYLTSPVRTKELTDDEIGLCLWKDRPMSLPEFARAVIAAYKEKQK